MRLFSLTGSRLRAVTPLLVLGVVACDLPSAPPRWTTTWATPAEELSLSVADFLPADVRFEGGSLATDVAPVSQSQSLGDLCDACRVLNGQMAPKPAFQGRVEAVAELPASVASASLAEGGVLRVTVNHSFGFDPIRPSASSEAPTGSLRVDVMHAGGHLLGRLSLSGDTAALPAGVSRVLELPLSADRPVTGPITLSVLVTSPLGDEAAINTAQGMTATGEIRPLRMAEAVVRLGEQSIEASEALDLSGLDQDLADRLTAAELELHLVNPFDVGGRVAVDFGVPGVAPKALTLQPSSRQASQREVLRLSADEVRALVGRVATLRISGTVNPTNGTVTVKPDLAVRVQARLFASVLLPSAN